MSVEKSENELEVVMNSRLYFFIFGEGKERGGKLGIDTFEEARKSKGREKRRKFLWIQQLKLKLSLFQVKRLDFFLSCLKKWTMRYTT